MTSVTCQLPQFSQLLIYGGLSGSTEQLMTKTGTLTYQIKTGPLTTRNNTFSGVAVLSQEPALLGIIDELIAAAQKQIGSGNVFQKAAGVVELGALELAKLVVNVFEKTTTTTVEKDQTTLVVKTITKAVHKHSHYNRDARE